MKKSLYGKLHLVVVKHMQQQDVNAKRALKDIVFTVRQLCENHKVSYADVLMDVAKM
jgi:hypothetical protein